MYFYREKQERAAVPGRAACLYPVCRQALSSRALVGAFGRAFRRCRGVCSQVCPRAPPRAAPVQGGSGLRDRRWGWGCLLLGWVQKKWPFVSKRL